MSKIIGVLSYQGGSELHISALKKLHFNYKRIFYYDDLEGLDGLILPGGESSVQYSYCMKHGMFEKILKFAASGKPILGTCAGSILLSKFKSDKVQGCGLIDMDIERNTYGRQIHSGLKISDQGNNVMFIRAPGVKNLGKSVEVIDTYKGQPIFVKQANIYCCTFHPEVVELNSRNILFKIFQESSYSQVSDKTLEKKAI